MNLKIDQEQLQTDLQSLQKKKDKNEKIWLNEILSF
jgi:hypothetical protein